MSKMRQGHFCSVVSTIRGKSTFTHGEILKKLNMALIDKLGYLVLISPLSALISSLSRPEKLPSNLLNSFPPLLFLLPQNLFHLPLLLSPLLPRSQFIPNLPHFPLCSLERTPTFSGEFVWG